MPDGFSMLSVLKSNKLMREKNAGFREKKGAFKTNSLLTGQS